jgi:hypothetical protein
MDDSQFWQEQRRLAEAYRDKWDDELRALAESYSDLTKPAQQALRDEMLRRGLADPLAPATPPTLNPAELPPAEGEPHDYTWKTPLCDCESMQHARLFMELLRRAGIESWIEGAGRYTWESNGPRLLVAADQLEHARTVLAQPIPEDVIEQAAESEAPAPFELPACPACGAADPVLVAVDPVNQWQCEACGHQWSDPAPAEPEN